MAAISTPVIAVIGAGPAGLMAAEQMANAGINVQVFDAMPTAARKFLMAGVGGMNITHAEALPRFLTRYADKESILTPFIQAFTPADLRNWIHDLGIETFVGSSNRVFPKEMKAAPLLRRWLERLRQHNVQFFMRHRWLGWADNGELLFEHQGEHTCFKADAVVLALGGASWPQLGSTGCWQSVLQAKNIQINPLVPSNCGFITAWSEVLRQQHSGKAIKNALFSCSDIHGNTWQQKGECVLTDYGIEGGAIYALSAALRDVIQQEGIAQLHIDFVPDKTVEQLSQQLLQADKSLSTSNVLRKKTPLSAAAIALLFEFHDKEQLRDRAYLAKAIKNLRIPLHACRPIAEVISSAGGIEFTELTDGLMLKKMPGVFCAGEMLDWEAPTGGYLLTACFATGVAAGKAATAYINALQTK